MYTKFLGSCRSISVDFAMVLGDVWCFTGLSIHRIVRSVERLKDGGMVVQAHKHTAMQVLLLMSSA